jgi:hypothetical protein
MPNHHGIRSRAESCDRPQHEFFEALRLFGRSQTAKRCWVEAFWPFRSVVCLDASELSALKASPCKICFPKVCVLQVRTFKMGADKLGVGESSFDQLGLAQVATVQDGSVKVGLLQSRTCKIGVAADEIAPPAAAPDLRRWLCAWG